MRELENEMQRALALAEPGETLGRIEAWLIRRALDTHDGQRAATARRLGITREGLYK